MHDQQRAALLGLLVGVAHTVVRLFVPSPGPTAIDSSLATVVLQSFLATAVLLAVIPGLALYGAMQLSASNSAPTRLAAVVAVATGVGVVVSYPLLTASSAGAPFLEALRFRFVGPYVVNAFSPAVHSGVGALAGFLLSAHRS